ncbi:site-specific DNA-methyltransferase [Methanomicrobium antiquum]|uniref:site-specific DNA-methyltransferase (cytosine-N(4)-specific) n=1 Tax=Methanomicrobium antiquum TaxID=487686 RepID=A0AAF0FRJ5_9EURY|nr:DNA methyltransferase [Methanomicrobium antiquum]WFN36546.1 site-specific DNA-methyltransferase [Methanomicrobium antiquum]
MELTGSISHLNLDNVPIDPFWNEGNEEEHKIHRIHAYPAKFPAFITTKAIEYSKNLDINVETIADIFCGCGTTSYEAKRNGIDFWGCDINPVATLIAEVKSRKYKDSTLLDYFKQITDKYCNISVLEDEFSNVNERIKYWYFDEQIKDLIRLKKAINVTIPKKSFYRKFFLCAFSNILKKTSRWLTKSIKPQLDPDKVPADVITAFTEQFEYMRKANLESELSENTKVNIKNINFLDKKNRKPFVDLLITSPPYVTSYEYADLHQLSTLWLEYTDDYKSLRNGTIGSLYNHSDFTEEAKKLNNVGSGIVFNLFTVDKKKAKAVARYYFDIEKSVKNSYKMIKDGGLALFVIGNTEYKGKRVDNAKHLIYSMNDAGFKEINVVKRKISKKILTPYRDEKGKFSMNHNDRKVYAEEFIVTGRKYAN